MTIMEEGSELLERLGGKGAMPMFTSCCPGWVRYLKINHPDKLAHLSSAKSPQQMFGALLKEYVGPKLGMVPPRQGAHELAGVREGAGLGIGVSTNPVGTGANDDASVAAAGETSTVGIGSDGQAHLQRVLHAMRGQEVRGRRRGDGARDRARRRCGAHRA